MSGSMHSKIEHCQCNACQAAAKEIGHEHHGNEPCGHESCCAVHNGPAYPPGPCNCKLRRKLVQLEDTPAFKIIAERVIARCQKRRAEKVRRQEK